MLTFQLTLFLRVLLEEQSWHELPIPQGEVKARSPGTKAWQLSHQALIHHHTHYSQVHHPHQTTALISTYAADSSEEHKIKGVYERGVFLHCTCHVTSIPHHHPMAIRSFPVAPHTSTPICFYLLAPMMACVYFCLQLYHNYVCLALQSFIVSFLHSLTHSVG